MYSSFQNGKYAENRRNRIFKQLYKKLKTGYKMRASTLAEILVVMIIASLILTIVMEGFMMFGQYCAVQNENMYDRIKLIDGYVTIDNIFYSSDSLIGFDVYKNGVVYGRFADADSVLTFEGDTIFRSVGVLKHGRDTMTIIFDDDQRIVLNIKQ